MGAGGIDILDTGSTFTDNKAQHAGVISAVGARVAFSGSNFRGNRADDGVGGALQVVGTYLQGQSWNDVDLTDVTFSANQALGGGAVNLGAVKAAILRTKFVGNLAETASGGGLVMTSGDMLIAESTFDNNTAVT